jgi:integrating conjugative element protein (TIGR03752 family)
MQFKAVVGRENLAANGWELPDDLAGMIVTGVAIGDMALSCSEGKIRSATFVFNDGTIRTVSARTGGRTGAGGGASGDLGFISDRYGNPCIAGKFVTNAPAYLTDIVGAKTLGVAASAYADAAKLVTQNASTGTTTSQVIDSSKYVLGQAVSGASDEVTSWLLSRLKNSFDAVVTPSGNELVIHLDQELRIDKLANARKLTHRSQNSQTSTRGALYGLE